MSRDGAVLRGFDQSTFFGFPQDRSSLARRDGTARPDVDARGAVVREVLAAIDGTRTVAELETLVEARFGAEHVPLVRRVTERYGTL